MTSPLLLSPLLQGRAAPPSPEEKVGGQSSSLEALLEQIRAPQPDTFAQEEEERKRREALSKRIQDEILLTPEKRAEQKWSDYLQRRYKIQPGEPPGWKKKLGMIFGETMQGLTTPYKEGVYDPRKKMREQALEEYKAIAGPLQRESAVLEATERAATAQDAARQKHKETLQLKVRAEINKMAVAQDRLDIARDLADNKITETEAMNKLRTAQTGKVVRETEAIGEPGYSGPIMQTAFHEMKALHQGKGEDVDPINLTAEQSKTLSEIAGKKLAEQKKATSGGTWRLNMDYVSGTGRPAGFRYNSKTGEIRSFSDDERFLYSGLFKTSDDRYKTLKDATQGVGMSRRQLMTLLSHPTAVGTQNVIPPQWRSLVGMGDANAVNLMTQQYINTLRLARAAQGSSRVTDQDAIRIEKAMGQLWNSPRDYVISQLTIYELMIGAKLEAQYGVYPIHDKVRVMFDELRESFDKKYAAKGQVAAFYKVMDQLTDEEIARRTLDALGLEPVKNVTGEFAGARPK